MKALRVGTWNIGSITGRSTEPYLNVFFVYAQKQIFYRRRAAHTYNNCTHRRTKAHIRVLSDHVGVDEDGFEGGGENGEREAILEFAASIDSFKRRMNIY